MKANNIKVERKKEILVKNSKEGPFAHFVFGRSLVALLILFAVVLSFASCKNQKRLDYINDPLDSYIDIKEEDYKGLNIVIDVNVPTKELDVENHILKLISNTKSPKPLYDAFYQYDIPVKAGDKAYIYYAGYELDENGNRKEIASLTNYAYYTESGYYMSNKPYTLFVGSGDDNFAPGFELSLIGAVPSNDVDFSANVAGVVQEGDVVYLEASYVAENGIFYDRANIRIDLSDENVEKVWGKGIYELLRSTAIGQTCATRSELQTEKGKIIYTDLKLNYTTSCEGEGNANVVKVTYPYDWNDESLRNKTVYFDVFLEKTLCYETKEFNDDFVKNVIGMSEDDLAIYEGETLVSKYKSYYLSVLMEKYKDLCRARAEELLWTSIKKNAKFTQLPEYEYNILYSITYNSYKNEFIAMSEAGNTYYTELDDYIASELGIGEEDDVAEALRNSVKDEIYEKLIFYSILKNENLLPKTDEEFQIIYNTELALDYEYYINYCGEIGEEVEYKTVEEYEAFIIDYYGEAFYIDSVYYNYTISKVLEMSNLVYSET